MTRVRWGATAVAAAAAALVFASPANADVDTDFSEQLETYGVYGQKDYNAWLAKISCKRLRSGLDADAGETVHFLLTNLTSTTEAQAWQFLGAAITSYCPDQTPVWENAAAQRQ